MLIDAGTANPCNATCWPLLPAIFISHSSLDHQIADDIKTVLDRALSVPRARAREMRKSIVNGGPDWLRRSTPARQAYTPC
jgi:hypothetical protein